MDDSEGGGFHLPQRGKLSRREAEIMGILYRLGAAGATEVHAHMIDAPSYSTVRKQLETLEEKGQIGHSVEGRRFIYRPVLERDEAGVSAARQLLTMFYRGSPSHLLEALLTESDMKLSGRELDKIVQLAEQARREGR